MTTEEKLISMLQSKDYVSKVKAYCNKCEYIIFKNKDNENIQRTAE